MTRGYIGAAFLLVIMLLTGKKPDLKAIKNNLLPLVLSGAAIGVNWILLFEAYNYTSVAVATLCYYMQPVMLIILTPFLLKEKLSKAKIICGFCHAHLFRTPLFCKLCLTKPKDADTTQTNSSG